MSKHTWIGTLLATFLTYGMVACGTLHKPTTAKQPVVQVEKPALPPELQRKYDYFFLEALRQKHKGNYDAAFELLSHCLSIDPQGDAALYEIQQYYARLGMPDKQEKMLQQAVKAAPDNYWYRQTLAAYYQSKKNYPKAIYVLEDMAKLYPERESLLLGLMNLYLITQEYDEVIHTLNRLERLEGKSEQISMQKVHVYMMQNDAKRAFDEMENLAKEYPYDMRYRTILGDLYLQNGKPHEAYETYQSILEKDHDYAPAMVSLANYYKQTGNDSLYRQQIDSVLYSDKVDDQLKTTLMSQLIIQSEQTDRDSTAMRDMLLKVIRHQPDNADMAMLAAQYLITKNMKKEVVPVLHQVLKIDPDNDPARLQLLTYAIQQQNADEVIRLAKPAIDMGTNNIEYYCLLVFAYHQTNKHDSALYVVQAGVEQINEKANQQIASDLYAIMGDLLNQDKQHEKAFAAYDSALVYKPDNIGVLNNYAYYLSLQNKELDRAEEMSNKTIKAEPHNSTYLDTYAWILFEKGKYAEAKIYIDQAMKNGGDSSSFVTEHCGDIYYMNGEHDLALTYWKKAEQLSTTTAGDEEARTAEQIAILRRKIATRKYVKP